MTRSRTPAERHERELDRMANGGNYDASAPVRRQGPKGRVRIEPLEPYDDLPEPVEEGAGSTGDAEEYASGDHAHPFPLSDAIPAKVDPDDAGSAGLGSLPAREGHTHGLDLSEQIPQPGTDGVGSAGNTGQVSDAGHAHHVDPQDIGVPEWAVDPTPDTLALRSPTGTVSVAPPTAPAHALAASEAATAATPSKLARRNEDGQVEVAPSTSGTHALADSQATVAATANAVVRRNDDGQTEVADATEDMHALNFRTGKGLGHASPTIMVAADDSLDHVIDAALFVADAADASLAVQDGLDSLPAGSKAP